MYGKGDLIKSSSSFDSTKGKLGILMRQLGYRCPSAPSQELVQLWEVWLIGDDRSSGIYEIDFKLVQKVKKSS